MKAKDTLRGLLGTILLASAGSSGCAAPSGEATESGAAAATEVAHASERTVVSNEDGLEVSFSYLRDGRPAATLTRDGKSRTLTCSMATFAGRVRNKTTAYTYELDLPEPELGFDSSIAIDCVDPQLPKTKDSYCGMGLSYRPNTPAPYMLARLACFELGAALTDEQRDVMTTIAGAGARPYAFAGGTQATYETRFELPRTKRGTSVEKDPIAFETAMLKAVVPLLDFAPTMNDGNAPAPPIQGEPRVMMDLAVTSNRATMTSDVKTFFGDAIGYPELGARGVSIADADGRLAPGADIANRIKAKLGGR